MTLRVFVRPSGAGVCVQVIGRFAYDAVIEGLPRGRYVLQVVHTYPFHRLAHPGRSKPDDGRPLEELPSGCWTMKRRDPSFANAPYREDIVKAQDFDLHRIAAAIREHQDENAQGVVPGVAHAGGDPTEEGVRSVGPHA